MLILTILLNIVLTIAAIAGIFLLGYKKFVPTEIKETISGVFKSGIGGLLKTFGITPQLLESIKSIDINALSSLSSIDQNLINNLSSIDQNVINNLNSLDTVLPQIDKISSLSSDFDELKNDLKPLSDPDSALNKLSSLTAPQVERLISVASGPVFGI
jgi:hypothetical protein